MSEDEPDFVDEDDRPLAPEQTATFSQAVLYASDWTVETVVSQLTRRNIDLNPRFQRRDAWGMKSKSRFIESIVLGLPIPQIVLAEKPGQRGQFIVLDGKQRLLSLLQFTGNAEEGPNNGFALSGMEARADLNRLRYTQMEQNADRVDDLNAFLNHTIRTVVIRNWPNTNFLHLVFLRLNTGSVKLSPQELRQAMVPGPFSDFIDDRAMASEQVRVLLSRETPDPRMRDVELMVRYVAFSWYLNMYAGRMKEFLDETCILLNQQWPDLQAQLVDHINEFNQAVDCLVQVFGADRIARKDGSRSFNRAIFDVLVFYASDATIRAAMIANPQPVRDAYAEVLADDRFSAAIESDTAGIPHTFDRFQAWGNALRGRLNIVFNLPTINVVEGLSRITFDGFR
nr:DUF262 domain-containing protein [Mesorhizobium sp. WSM4875]